MPYFLAVFLGVAATSAPAAETSEPAVESLLTMPVEGSVTIDTAGKVESYTIETKVVPSLRAVLDRAITSWKFHPVLVGGQPTRALARMRVVLAAVPSGKDYQVHIDSVVFLDPPGDKAEAAGTGADPCIVVPKSMRPPVYPRGALMAGVTGRVLLGLQVAPDGKLLDVAAVQSMVFNVRGREGDLREAISQLERSAVDAARKWTFEAKSKPGHASETKAVTVMTTVEYVLTPTGHKDKNATDADNVGEWRYVNRLPRREMPWVKDTTGLQQVGVADVENGELVPLATAFQLASPVDGGAP